jgi:hypothetical protein
VAPASVPSHAQNKLAAALANKLARIAWSILRNGGTFGAQRTAAEAA